MKSPANLPPPVHRPRRRFTGFFASVLVVNFALAGGLFADDHTTGAPALSSSPGAAYTVYLDFSGFNYTGTWGGQTPDSSAAYADIPATGTFAPQQISDIRAIWAGVAAQYAAFNINVTTVDPAVAAGQNGTDLLRQTFYSATPNLMHTIITNQSHNGVDWYGTGFAGVSFTGTTTGTESNSGGHTNWIFSAGTQYNEVGNIPFLAQDATHENGHGLGLSHQSDFSGNTLINGYSLGDNNANGPKTGPGTYGAIMGSGDYAQRLAFRAGDASNNTPAHFQNDVGVILSTNTAANAAALGRTGGADLHLKNDGIGRTPGTATGLALQADGTVDFSQAKGVIVPNTEMGPQPTGAENYTTDHFKFTLSSSTTISLTVHDGTELLVAGVADSNGSLRSTLTIYLANGTMLGALVGTATEAADTLSETFSGLLAAGDYYALVGSYGGHAQQNAPGTGYNASNYYDMGTYFLTGSGFAAVPEPSTWVLMLLGGGGVILGVVVRRRGQLTVS